MDDDEEEAIRLKEIMKSYRDRAAERRDKGGEEVSFLIVLILFVKYLGER